MTYDVTSVYFVLLYVVFIYYINEIQDTINLRHKKNIVRRKLMLATEARSRSYKI